MLVVAMVAADRQDGIAKSGDLPWRIPGDLKRMKQMTTGAGTNAVLMGRTTFETLPGALPKRLNMILTRKADANFPGALTVTSWDEALEAAERYEVPELWVLGGAEIYTLALQQLELTRIELTRIDGDFDCDVRWPGVPADFSCADTSDWITENGVTYRYERWVRSALENR